MDILDSGGSLAVASTESTPGTVVDWPQLIYRRLESGLKVTSTRCRQQPRVIPWRGCCRALPRGRKAVGPRRARGKTRAKQRPGDARREEAPWHARRWQKRPAAPGPGGPGRGCGPGAQPASDPPIETPHAQYPPPARGGSGGVERRWRPARRAGDGHVRCYCRSRRLGSQLRRRASDSALAAAAGAHTGGSANGHEHAQHA
jgi:hypothetical protein